MGLRRCVKTRSVTSRATRIRSGEVNERSRDVTLHCCDIVHQYQMCDQSGRGGNLTQQFYRLQWVLRANALMASVDLPDSRANQRGMANLSCTVVLTHLEWMAIKCSQNLSAAGVSLP